MHIENDKSVVVISIPRFVVPAHQAKKYILAANSFWTQINNTKIDDFGKNQMEFDNKYCHGKFIPTIKTQEDFSNVLGERIDVEQIDKYIVIEEKDGFVDSETVEKLWNPANPEVEETEED